MKNSFPGYYRPTEDEFAEVWENCLFVLDANVLLNLYRYSAETREGLLDILQGVSEHLWIPHQAALEYQRNRLSVIGQQIAAYARIQKLLADYRNKLENELRSLVRHPFLDVDCLLGKITTTFTEIEKEVEELGQEHPDLITDDPIREAVTTLLEGKVGPLYSTEHLSTIYKEGKTRYENEVPPGYQDADKGGSRQYGDLILWFQIIDQAQKAKQPIILVTDDRKGDWWLKFNGRTIGPRPELVNEMVSKADVSFYMYPADPFMEYASEYLERQISQRAIEEVREVRQHDEEYLEVARLARTSLLLHEALTPIRIAAQIPSGMQDMMRAATQEAQDAVRMAAQLSSGVQDAMRVATQEAQDAVRMATQLSSGMQDMMRAATQEAQDAVRMAAQLSSGVQDAMEIAAQLQYKTLEAREESDQEEVQDKESDESDEQIDE